jgi:hypothetical protein
LGAFWIFWAIRPDEHALLIVTVVFFPLMSLWFLWLYRRDRQLAPHQR